MGIIIFGLVTFFSMLGVYYLVREIIYAIIYKKMNVGNHIECKIIIDNYENDLEMFLNKFLYVYLDNTIFQNVTILMKNSNKNTKYILDNVKLKYDFLNIEYEDENKNTI